MLKLLLVFVGGGFGASMRYGVGVLVARLTPASEDTPHWLGMYPAATLIVNMVGCGLIGLAWGLLGKPEEGNEALRLALIVGVLGGFTTFSAFGWELLDLMNNGRAGAAIGYALVSVVLGLGCVWVGHALGSSMSAA